MDLILDTGKKIENCLGRILAFCAIDVYVSYDRKAGAQARQWPNRITRDDLRAANRDMRARSAVAAWDQRALLEEDLPEIAALPRDEDLVEVAPATWREVRPLVRRAYQRICGPRVGAVAASKVLYLKRPRLVAICDSFVEKALGIRGHADQTTRVMQLTERIRSLGTREETLRLLNRLSTRLGQVTIEGSRIELSNTRILDILLWTSEQPQYARLFSVADKMTHGG